jgi:hypothetical protein
MAEAQAINTADDRAAQRDPCTLMRHLLPGYRRRPHVRLIGREMARLHAGDGDRLMILTPPQVGKTVTAVVGGAFWWLTLHPTHRVIIGSYGNTLAINRGRSVRKLVIEHGHRYDIALARGSAGVADWELTSGGGVKSVGIGAGVAGSPGDLGLIDDPHKSRADADSLRKREMVYDWYSADFLTRLAPGSPVLLIMTPWHPDDLRARVLRDEGEERDGGRWRVVRMPALADDPADPLGRPAGTPLPHPKIPTRDTAAALAHWQERRRSTRLRDFFALYQCNPQPDEGALLSRDLLRERRCWQTGSPGHPCAPAVKHAVAVDPSGGGRDTAGIIAGYLGEDRKLYLTHDRTAVMSSDAWSREAVKLAVEIGADRIIAEKNYGGDMVTLAIRTAWDALRREELEQIAEGVKAAKAIGAVGLDGLDQPRRTELEQIAENVKAAKELLDLDRLARTDLYRKAAKYNRLPPRVVTVTSRKGKLLRAEPIAQQWTEDRIRTAAYLPELEEEWATWQPDNSDSPGRIDASVHLAYGLLPPPPMGYGAGGQQPTGPIMPTTGASPLAGGGGAGPGGFGALGGGLGGGG